jgi:hypothetical protein
MCLEEKTELCKKSPEFGHGKDSVTRWEYFLEGQNILISAVLSMYALVVFMVFQKFSLCPTFITFLFASLKLVTKILKMLPETPVRILFSVIGRYF